MKIAEIFHKKEWEDTFYNFNENRHTVSSCRMDLDVIYSNKPITAQIVAANYNLASRHIYNNRMRQMFLFQIRQGVLRIMCKEPS